MSHKTLYFISDSHEPESTPLRILDKILQESNPRYTTSALTKLIFLLWLYKNTNHQMKIKEIVRRYLKDSGRNATAIKAIVRYLQTIKIPTEFIENIMELSQNILQDFKIVMLIHECLIRGVLVCEGTIQILGKIYPMSLKKKNNNLLALQKYLLETTLEPYTLYLQKKVKSQMESDSNCSSIFTNFNLIQRGLSIVNIIPIFGRYFQNTYQFGLDFNILLAKDIKKQYQLFERQLEVNSSLANDESVAKQIEKINDKMRVLFCNRYFADQIYRYAPKFINSDENCPNRTFLHTEIPQNKTYPTMIYPPFRQTTNNCTETSHMSFYDSFGGAKIHNKKKSKQSGRAKMQKLFSSLNAKKLNTDSTSNNAGQQDNKDLERMGLMKSMVRIVEMLEKMEARS